MSSPSLNGYPQLLARIKGEIDTSRKEINHTRALAYWKIGEIIHKDILKHKARADYGDSLYDKLSKDLNIDERTLQRSVHFHNEFPIPAPGTELPWSHYRALLGVHDRMIRDSLAKLAKKEGFTKRELEEEIASLRPPIPAARSSATKLTAVRGRLYVYQQIKPGTFTPEKGKVIVDCGFNFWAQVSKAENPDMKIVTERKDMTYTYRAYVEEVIDGDTLWLQVDLGFGNVTRQKVRLRGVDAPELAKSEGQRAKKFVEKALGFASNRQRATSNEILVRSSKSDKYDRYLADVFFGEGETFLNQQLLDEGLAIGYKE